MWPRQREPFCFAAISSAQPPILPSPSSPNPQQAAAALLSMPAAATAAAQEVALLADTPPIVQLLGIGAINVLGFFAVQQAMRGILDKATPVTMVKVVFGWRLVGWSAGPIGEDRYWPVTAPTRPNAHTRKQQTSNTKHQTQVRLALRADGGGLRKRLNEMPRLSGAGPEGLWLTLEETVNEIVKRKGAVAFAEAGAEYFQSQNTAIEAFK